MKTFCVIPWHSQEIDFVTGKENVCCWINKDISRSSLQQKFLSGESPQECDNCWQSEKSGIESRRQMENRFLDFKLSRDIESIQSDSENGVSQINLYQFFVGSICNGTCVTCGSHFSSAWRKLSGATTSIKQENLQADQHFAKYSNDINWKLAKRINLVGGEPLLHSRSFDILRRLLDVGNTDCRVSFVTNGNVSLSDSQIEIVRHFSDISCCVSIDGLGRSFEYIRYPLSWPNLLQNLERYREIFTEVVVSFTVSNLNYYAREDIIDWFKKMGLLYIENYVTSPDFFNYEVRPGHKLWTKFVSEIDRQDRLKGINIRDYIPEMYDFIENSRNTE